MAAESCDAAAGGLSVKARKGSALLFFNMDPQCAQEADAALHQGCPVLEGDKWSMTVWMHQQNQNEALFGTKRDC